MRRAGSWLAALGSSFLLAAGAPADPPLLASASPPGPAAAAPPAGFPVEDQELRGLLDKLSALADRIGQATQSPDVWRLHLEEGELLVQIAGHSRREERDNWLRMAADSYFSAAITSPDGDQTAAQRLVDFPGVILQVFPGSPIAAYAALQDIQADCTRMLMKSSDNPALVQGHRRDRLLRFAQEFPRAPEAPKAVLEAARISEALGRTEDACTCYRYLADHFPADPLARKVSGALWRMGVNSEPLSLALPLLFSPLGPGAPRYNLYDLRGRFVVVYFWSSTCPKVSEDFATLKQLTDRYRDHGLEMVYVNLDADPNQGRNFLAGRLTAGEHLYQAGGLDGPVAERYGIHNLPEAFLVGRDGTVLRHSLRASQLEAELSGLLPAAVSPTRP